MGNDVISIEHASKTFRTGFLYRKVEAVRDVTFSVEEGDIFGFLGPNGAGKTTTIKMLMGLIFPTGGTLSIFGRPHTDIASRAALGYAPEQPYFYEYLTGSEFLDYYGQLFGVPSAERRRRIPLLFEMVGLRNCADLALRRYSKGMLQRIGIAQALVNDPRLLVLDEPMSGLDPIGRREIRDLILALKKRGKTIFFSTHILPDVEMICDRVAIIVKGELRRLGRIDEFAELESEETEVCFRGLSAEAIGKLSGETGAPVVRGTLAYFSLPSRDRAQSFIGEGQAGGGSLVSLTPRRRSLEDVFMSEARK
ncbi:MAG: ABC transporter ATP-binding protein [Deltaproteobacteria bacterium]|nr:ABC transporter ATP-binding protein [Deltaproteobacteria bacterium]